jgi:hypothetical protein
LIIFVIFRRMAGREVGTVRSQFVLPVVLLVIGWGDATKGLTKPVEITFTIIGCAVSLVFGLARGGADRISERNRAPYVQWGWLSVGLFAANLIVKLVLDLVGVAAGETAGAAGSSLLVSLALTLIGEAVVVWYRTGGASQLNAGPPPAGVGYPVMGSRGAGQYGADEQGAGEYGNGRPDAGHHGHRDHHH